MKKRDFLKKGTILTVGALTVPLAACDGQKKSETSKGTQGDKSLTGAPFELPDLPYDKSALEPHIDKMTMTIHHDRHHAGYVRKLNNALEGHSMAGQSLEDIMMNVGADDTGVRNNGGGHYNHSLFWKVMQPGGEMKPEGKLSDAINATFGSFDTFRESFSNAAATRFGSGWAWLSVDSDGKLFVSSTPNQDNPLMKSIVKQSGTPILGIDVWEHAYYLKYQNMRKDYIDNFFNLINWQEVAKNYDALV